MAPQSAFFGRKISLLPYNPPAINSQPVQTTQQIAGVVYNTPAGIGLELSDLRIWFINQGVVATSGRLLYERGRSRTRCEVTMTDFTTAMDKAFAGLKAVVEDCPPLVQLVAHHLLLTSDPIHFYRTKELLCRPSIPELSRHFGRDTDAIAKAITALADAHIVVPLDRGPYWRINRENLASHRRDHAAGMAATERS